jgi:PAS domain S-box-containing protein
MGTGNPERVLIHAPYGRDGALIGQVLRTAGISAEVCSTLEEVTAELNSGVGAVILADEGLRPDNIEQFSRPLRDQESWSDLPVIVLTGAGEANKLTRHRLRLLTPLANVTLLERPLRTETAISAVQTALRARRHQYRVRDLMETQRKVMEALRESEDHLRHTVELNPQVPWTANPDGTLESFSDRWCNLTGLSREEALRGGWSIVAHPDDGPAGLDAWFHSVRTGEPYDVEQQIRLADGSFCWMRSRARPRRSETGEIVRWYGTTEDVHERRLAEEKLHEANAELRATNRELEEFAYVSSHDLQEPLRMINIYTQMLMRKLEGNLDRDILRYSDFIQKGVRRMENLLQDLLCFSRLIHQESRPAEVADLSAALEQALSTLSPLIQEVGAMITYNGLPTVQGQEGQLSQVFQNLLSNALKYRNPNEQLQIGISARRDASGWVIGVRDNGIGFEQKHAERIFGLFKRLYRDEYPGTGVGLAICKRILERNGGRIWAESEPNRGSTFYFTAQGADIHGAN